MLNLSALHSVHTVTVTLELIIDNKRQQDICEYAAEETSGTGTSRNVGRAMGPRFVRRG